MKIAKKRTIAGGMDTDSFQAPQLGMPDAPGVGARQAKVTPPDSGGGYQDVCTGSNFGPPAGTGADRRLDDLVAMHMKPIWVDVARAIGIDNFLTMWRMLEAYPPFLHDDGRLRMKLRGYGSYVRFQRNRYIEALHRLQLPLPEIKRRVEIAFGERLTEEHLSRFGTRKR